MRKSEGASNFKCMKHLTSLFLLFFLFSSCLKKEKADETFVSPDDTLQISHARGFAIFYHDGFKEVVVYNPWEIGLVYARYYLTNDKDRQTPENGTKVHIPLQTIALTSVTQIEFLNVLEELNTVTGMCSPHLVYNTKIREGVLSGKIVDLGDSFSMNVEKTLVLNPQALMTSGYNQNDPNVTRISQAKIPALFNNEWMETTLLGRAEWIKFVAAFYDKEAQADSIFSLVEQNYNEIKNLAAGIKQEPNIMSGSNFRGTWYMPGGKSFMGQLFADAGAAYFYADDTSSGSLPLNIETVIKNFAQADVWLNCNFNSIVELQAADAKHALFRPVSLGEVYNFNKRALPSSANDFWESAVARPDLLLADVIAILHPSILPEHELVYAEKLSKTLE